MTYLKNLFLIPSFPFIAICTVYFLIKYVIECGGISEFLMHLQLTSDEEIDELNDEMEIKYYYLEPIYYALSTIGWFLIIKNFIL